MVWGLQKSKGHIRRDFQLFPDTNTVLTIRQFLLIHLFPNNSKGIYALHYHLNLHKPSDHTIAIVYTNEQLFT